jgi:hypothetical protein
MFFPCLQERFWSAGIVAKKADLRRTTPCDE